MACPHPMIINGELVQAEGGKVSPVINPATGKEFDTVPDASKADANRAVAAAKYAFAKWRSTPFADRAKVLIAFADELDARKVEFAEALTREQGKPIGFATGEIGTCAKKARMMADPKLGDLTPEEFEKNAKGTCMVHWEPRGVVVGIMPWNFPISMAANKLFPAVATGNTVVLKPSPFTPLATIMLAEIVAKTFPPGVVNIITGSNDCGQTLVEHPDVRMITFTGSTATGKKIMATSAGHLKKVMLELGGNDPAIILPGSDVQKIAPTIFDKAMFNTGQVCVALKRLYVHSSQYEEMVEALAKKAKTVTLGDGLEAGTDYGPLNNKMQLERVEMLVNDAKSSGARIVAGGERVQPTGCTDGYFYAPTIIADVSDSAKIVCEEQFGPALPVLKYDDVEDAISRANDTDYGLAASVWGPDVKEAAAIGARLQAGSIWLNTHLGSGTDIDAPFGGIKQSGIGTEAGGKQWLKSFCDEKYLYIPAAAEASATSRKPELIFDLKGTPRKYQRDELYSNGFKFNCNIDDELELEDLRRDIEGGVKLWQYSSQTFLEVCDFCPSDHDLYDRLCHQMSGNNDDIFEQIRDSYIPQNTADSVVLRLSDFKVEMKLQTEGGDDGDVGYDGWLVTFSVVPKHPEGFMSLGRSIKDEFARESEPTETASSYNFKLKFNVGVGVSPDGSRRKLITDESSTGKKNMMNFLKAFMSKGFQIDLVDPCSWGLEIPPKPPSR